MSDEKTRLTAEKRKAEADYLECLKLWEDVNMMYARAEYLLDKANKNFMSAVDAYNRRVVYGVNG